MAQSLASGVCPCGVVIYRLRRDPPESRTREVIMEHNPIPCPDCVKPALSRRDFLRAVGVTAAAAAATGLPLFATPKLHAAPATPKSAAETAAKALFDTLTDQQRKEICFAWDYTEKERGLLRTFVSNNWQVTKPHIRSDFYTKKQQELAHEVFANLISPKWYNRMAQHLKDDTGGA